MLIVFAAAALAFVAALAAVTGLHVAYGEWISLLGPTALCGVVLAIYARKVRFDQAVDAAECIIALTFLAPTAVLASYLAIFANLPLTDDLLSRWDAALAFDWLGLIHRIDRSPVLVRTLTVAYSAFSPQLFCLPVLLSLAGYGLRAKRTLLSFGLICLASSAIATFFPAIGTFGLYQPTDLVSIDPANANSFLTQFEAVRSDPAFVLKPITAEGILTFPSVHAAVALLAIWAAWPLASLRPFVLALNVLMLLSTFTNANHYLSDVAAGLAVAAACIVLAREIPQSRGLFGVLRQRHEGLTSNIL